MERRFNGFRHPITLETLEAVNHVTSSDAHIGQVSLTVRDLDRAVLFYRDVLGFRESKRAGRTSTGWAPKAAAR